MIKCYKINTYKFNKQFQQYERVSKLLTVDFGKYTINKSGRVLRRYKGNDIIINGLKHFITLYGENGVSLYVCLPGKIAEKVACYEIVC